MGGVKLLFYPAFENASELTDHFYRLHWFLHPFRDRIDEVVIPITSDEVAVGSPPDFLDPSLVDLIGGINIRFLRGASAAEQETLAASADCVFAWKIGDDGKPAPNPLVHAKRIVRIDHRKLRGATSFYLMFAQTAEDLQASYLARSRRVFEDIRKSCQASIGYVFGTGPNLALATLHDFSDGVAIACNSMVRNYALMDRLKPPLIVVADPIFHAGPSSYAAAFRKDLIRALDLYGSHLIVPMRDYHVYLAHLPERFANRIAAIPFKAGEEPNLDLSASYHVTTTSNVLTLFLLPLASTFFDEVRIFGCDGRSMSESSYFWGHDRASQFNDKLGAIRLAHPAFFEIDYEDYYQTHCRVVGEWVGGMEGVGKVVTNHTPSFIPALAERSVGPLIEKARQDRERLWGGRLTGALFVSIDPEVGRNIGHYTPMNDRMAAASRSLGIEFLTYGNRDSSALPERRSYLRPCFNVNSWSFRMRDNGNPSMSYDMFCDDLRAMRNDLRRLPASRDICIFMYCGSFSAAEAMMDVFANEANVTLAVNLFYASFVPYGELPFVQRWKPVLERFVANGRNRLFGSTEQLAEGMSEVFGVPVHALPYPSTTFDDDADLSKWKARKLGPGTLPSVLFPGAMREEKGFLTAMETVRCLTQGFGPRYRCVIAGRAREDTPPALVNALEEVRGDFVTVEDRVLDDSEFIEFLASGDIIVLPYKPSAFKDRPSGILIDTISLGKPIVAVEGTWLADAIAAYGWGEVAADDPVAIAAAVHKIIPRYQTYVDALHTTRDAYLQKNSWRKVVETVFAFVEPSNGEGVKNAGDPPIMRRSATVKLTDTGRKLASIATFAREEVRRINQQKTTSAG